MFKSETQQGDKRAVDEVVMDSEHLTGLIWEAPDKETTDNPGRTLSCVMSKNMERLGAEKQLLDGKESSTSRRKSGEEEGWTF